MFWAIYIKSEEYVLLGQAFIYFLLMEHGLGVFHNYLLILGPIYILGQSPRPNIQSWALAPTIAPPNLGFFSIREEKQGFDLLSTNTIWFCCSHVWRLNFLCIYGYLWRFAAHEAPLITPGDVLSLDSMADPNPTVETLPGNLSEITLLFFTSYIKP